MARFSNHVFMSVFTACLSHEKNFMVMLCDASCHFQLSAEEHHVLRAAQSIMTVAA